jgi:hypothetical protein
MKQQYRKIKFRKKNLILLEKIKEILKEYDQKGIKVTLRQLYYQLVARDIIPNQIKEYTKLSGLLTNARYSGVIDWDAIEDRTRIPKIPNTFKDINHLLDVAKRSYQLNRWKGQKYYIEIWTEKDAISSVIQPLCKKYQVCVSVNRGYSSASSMYESAQRFLEQEKTKILLYLGDHDPSGLDMDRDIQTRLNEFGVDVEVIRIGLTSEQIKKYNPPTNPAKLKDPRSKWYVENFGYISREIDALKPEVLQELIKSSILKFLDLEKYEQVKKIEKKDIELLKRRVAND